MPRPSLYLFYTDMIILTRITNHLSTLHKNMSPTFSLYIYIYFFILWPWNRKELFVLKVIHQKCTANIIVNEETFDVFFSDKEQE